MEKKEKKEDTLRVRTKVKYKEDRQQRRKKMKI